MTHVMQQHEPAAVRTHVDEELKFGCQQNSCQTLKRFQLLKVLT